MIHRRSRTRRTSPLAHRNLGDGTSVPGAEGRSREDDPFRSSHAGMDGSVSDCDAAAGVSTKPLSEASRQEPGRTSTSFRHLSSPSRSRRPAGGPLPYGHTGRGRRAEMALTRRCVSSSRRGEPGAGGSSSWHPRSRWSRRLLRSRVVDIAAAHYIANESRRA